MHHRVDQTILDGDPAKDVNRSDVDLPVCTRGDRMRTLDVLLDDLRLEVVRIRPCRDSIADEIRQMVVRRQTMGADLRVDHWSDRRTNVRRHTVAHHRDLRIWRQGARPEVPSRARLAMACE